MKSTKTFICCFCIILFAAYSSNIYPKGNLSALEFRTINTSNGLTHNTVNTIFKDKRGFIWIGTQTGLCRYDGINVKNYPKINSYSIFSICETDSVNLWIGTDDGLLKLDRQFDDIKNIMLVNNSSTVKALYTTPNKDLLVGTDEGLFILKGNQTEKILFDNNALSQSNAIAQIIEDDSKGLYWITTADGLVSFDISKKKHTIYKNSQPTNGINNFSSIAKIGSSLYLGTDGLGIIRFDIRTHTFSPFPEIGNKYIMSLRAVGKDSLYVATNGSGLKLVSIPSGKVIDAIEHSNRSNSISSNAVYTFLQDGSNFWIGTYMGGVSYTPAKDDKFRVYSFLPQFNSKGLNVRSFWIGEDGRRLIGTRDGLFYVSEKENITKLYTTNSSILTSDIILFIFPSEDDFLIGTYGGGLYRFNTKKESLSYFKNDSFFKEGSFLGCTRDKNGNIWIGTSKGVCVYTPATDKFVIYDNSNSGLGNSFVFTVMCDSKNRMWLGTSNSVVMYESTTKTFNSKIFPANISPFIRSVRYIYEDKNNNIWFCDNKEGVVKVNEQFTKFEHLTKADFLPDNSIVSIIEDKSGMWFSSQKGLIHYNEKNNQSQLFSVYDGIPGYIFNCGVQETLNKSIWWGNEQGLVYLNKNEESDNISQKLIYPPVITSISVGGKLLHAGDGLMPNTSEFTSNITILNENNNIEFTFSALTYSENNTDIYEYLLEGYDSDWQKVTDYNRASYSNLPAGDYTFKVRHSSFPDLITSVKIQVVTVTPVIIWVILASAIASFIVLIFSYSRLLGKYRQIRNNRIEQGEKKKYSKSRMEGAKVNEAKGKLLEHMQKDKPYLNPDLKLQDIAKSIDCSPVDVSQLLNEYLNTNFTDFINEYRINEFIEQVQSSSAAKYTLTSLYEECGFSSRTSFFRSFKKIKGKTPAEYIKESGVKLQK